MEIQVNEDGIVVLSDVFNPIVISTDDGDFVICERNGSIEVSYDSKIVYSRSVTVYSQSEQ